MRSRALRRDDIRNSFSLSKIHLTIDKSATRELTRSGNTRSRIDKKLQNRIDDKSGGMAGNLHRILAGVGVRRTEHADYHIVQHAAVSLENRPVTKSIALGFSQRTT